MKAAVFTIFALSVISYEIFGVEINENTLPGRYVVEAKYLMKKATFALNIQNASQFEIQRTDKNPNAKICAGQYRIADVPNNGTEIGQTQTKRFEGDFSCPNKPNERADFNITFKNISIEDLKEEARVEIASSLAKGKTFKVKMKRL